MQSKYRGGEIYKGIFNYLGYVEMKNGCRIITNSRKNQDWMKVFYSPTYGQIYILKSILPNKIIESTKDFNDKEEWPKLWKGEKYVNFKLVYQGQFYFMMKHTSNEKSKQYVQSQDGFEVFVGSFQYDKRHTKPNDQDQIQIINGNIIGKTINGVWDNGKRQGKFSIKTPTQSKNNIKKLKEINELCYINDMPVGPNRELKKQGEPVRNYSDDFYIGITKPGVDSLKQGQCLYTEMVDFFFKHLNSSFQKNLNRVHNMKAFTVFLFQKLVPSQNVSAQRQQNVNIHYQAVKNIGNVYRNTSSIFQVNPLILMPLNRDRSHFALGAIKTDVKRVGDKLDRVDFTVYYLDSLHNTQQCVPVIIKDYIKKQIQQNILYESEIYKKGLNNCKTQFKSLKFSRQKNEVDCGVFTCIYGFLLTVQVCLSNRYIVNWQWKQPADTVNFIRKLIKQDAYLNIHKYFDVIMEQFVKKGIIIDKQQSNHKKSK